MGTSHRTAGGKEFVSIKHHIKQNLPHFIFSQSYSGPAPTNKSPPRGDGTAETQTSHAVSPFAFHAQPLTSCVLFPGKLMIVSQQPSKLCRRQKQASLLHLPHKQPLERIISVSQQFLTNSLAPMSICLSFKCISELDQWIKKP